MCLLVLLQMNYDYAQNKFCPPSALPGFMNHQSERVGAASLAGAYVAAVSTRCVALTPYRLRCPRPSDCVVCGPAEQWNVRDYDFYGAAYSILSAIGTGGLNAVVCGIPARDAGEFQAFPQSGPATETSIDFYRTWFAWASDNQVRALSGRASSL